MQSLSALAVLALGHDMPGGNFHKLQKSEEMQKRKIKLAMHLKSDAKGQRRYRASPRARQLPRLDYCFGVELAEWPLTTSSCSTSSTASASASARPGSWLLASDWSTSSHESRPVGGFISEGLSKRFGMRGRLWGLWGIQTLECVLCIVLGLVDSSFGTSVGVKIFFSFFVQAAEGLVFGVVPFVSRRALGVVNGMTGGGGSACAVLTQYIFFTGSRYSTETGIVYMGIMILAYTLPVALIYFPQWGGMFMAPSLGATAEDYYNQEWTVEERDKGLNVASVRFAENCGQEAGKKAVPRHTVPVDASPMHA